MNYEDQATKIVDTLNLGEQKRTEMIRDLVKAFNGIDNKYLDRLISCSFCGKRANEVKKLIAGPAVYICCECVQLCVDILSGEGLIK